MRAAPPCCGYPWLTSLVPLKPDFFFFYFIDVECDWVWQSCSSQIFGCNFIFRGGALGAWCVISLQGSILLMFHLGNPVTDVNDIWCGMSTLKVVGLILFRTPQYEYFTFESGLLNMDYIYILPRSYVVCGSEKGDVSLYDVSKNRFSHKRNVKVGRMVPENLL
jgi:hypothetical protein